MISYLLSSNCLQKTLKPFRYKKFPVNLGSRDGGTHSPYKVEDCSNKVSRHFILEIEISGRPTSLWFNKKG